MLCVVVGIEYVVYVVYLNLQRIFQECCLDYIYVFFFERMLLVFQLVDFIVQIFFIVYDVYVDVDYSLSFDVEDTCFWKLWIVSIKLRMYKEIVQFVVVVGFVGIFLFFRYFMGLSLMIFFEVFFGQKEVFFYGFV